MRKIEIVDELKSFPIGGIPESNMELLSKAEIVSHLARFQDEFYMMDNPSDREKVVREFYTKLLGSELPDIVNAAKNLDVNLEFINDYDKIQMIKESNENYSHVYETISSMMDIEKEKKNNL